MTEEKLIEIICNVSENTRFSNTENLLDEGVLDSLGVILLSETLEDEGYFFNPTQLPHNDFTVNGILDYINKYRAE